jgi:hypothetical protein
VLIGSNLRPRINNMLRGENILGCDCISVRRRPNSVETEISSRGGIENK